MKTRGASNADTDLRLSPWELLKTDNFTPQFLLPEESNKILTFMSIIKEAFSEETSSFEEEVNTKKYKHYLEYVILPMDLSKIERRIANRYYRSIDSLRSDSELIALNAGLFNEKNSFICESSEKLKGYMSIILSNIDNPVQHILSLLLKNKN